MLNSREIDFICTIAKDFISSYKTLDGKIKIDDEENPEELAEEINICYSLIKKFTC